MKAFIILCLLCFNSILYAQNSNKEEILKTEEFTSYGIDNIQKRTRVIYKFNTQGLRTERIVYYRNDRGNWTPVQMHSFKYNNLGKIADVIYTKWDKDNSYWNEVSEHLIHIYDYNGKLLTIQKCKKDTNSTLAYN